MSRVVAGQVTNKRGKTGDLMVRRSGSTVTFEVEDGKPVFRVQATSSAVAKEFEGRAIWWLSRREFASFVELHEHVEQEIRWARACAARMQRGSVFRTGPGFG